MEIAEEDQCIHPTCKEPKYRSPGGFSNSYCKGHQSYMVRKSAVNNRLKEAKFLEEWDEAHGSK